MRKTCALIFLVVVAVGVQAKPGERLAEQIVLTPMGGGTAEDREIAAWQKRAAAAEATPEAFERLGWALVAKARRTLDAGYFSLAEKTAEAMDARFGVSGESRLLRGHVAHNLHRFSEAEAVARALVAERGLAVELALLSDALVEQGKLAEAVEVLQRLVNVKPGAEAFTRIAHLRWLKGDLPGATAAMETALRAGSPREGESYGWTLVRLSGLYLQAGRLSAALTAAESAGKHVADYAPAWLARGRALSALGREAEAIGALQRAADLNPLPEYQWWLADVLRAAGKTAEAAVVEGELQRRGELGDPRTLALFLATRGASADKAVRLSREELAQRADVHTQDALAWALAATGELAAAEVAMRAALAEGTKDARLFFHAGEIALARGQAAEAREHFQQAKVFGWTLTPGERSRVDARLEGATAARAD